MTPPNPPIFEYKNRGEPKAYKDRRREERRLAGELGAAEARALNKLMKHLGNPANIYNVPNEFWVEYGQELNRILTRSLQGTLLGELQRYVNTHQPSPDWGDLVKDGNRWSLEYVTGISEQIAANSRKIAAEIVQNGLESGLSIDEIRNLLAGRFGPQHAEMVAITELTRANAEAAAIMANRLEEMGVQTMMRWLTEEDEKVCEICGPLDHKVQGDGWVDIPPAHPRCRCDVVVEAAG